MNAVCNVSGLLRTDTIAGFWQHKSRPFVRRGGMRAEARDYMPDRNVVPSM